MTTITLPKVRYRELKRKAHAYDSILRFIEGDFFSPPPIRSTRRILSEFEKIGKYKKEFLKSLGKGLMRSSYFKK